MPLPRDDPTAPIGIVWVLPMATSSHDIVDQLEAASLDRAEKGRHLGEDRCRDDGASLIGLRH
jgi:hypothetical protein